MRKLRRLRDSPIGGTVIAVLALLLGALSWAGLFFPDSAEEKVRWMAAFFGVFAISVVWMIYAYLTELGSLRERLKPVLSITLGPRVRPYFQEDPDPPSLSTDPPPRVVRYVRVGVANHGGPIEKVALTLERFVDLGNPKRIHAYAYPGHRLRVMDGVRRRPDASFDLPSGDNAADVAYVDVASETTVPDAPAYGWWLAYAQEGLPNAVIAGRYKLTLRLDAGQAPPVRLDVVLDQGEDGAIRLSEA